MAGAGPPTSLTSGEMGAPSFPVSPPVSGDRQATEVTEGQGEGGAACPPLTTHCPLSAQEGHETQRAAAVPLPEGRL